MLFTMSFQPGKHFVFPFQTTQPMLMVIVFIVDVANRCRYLCQCVQIALEKLTDEPCHQRGKGKGNPVKQIWVLCYELIHMPTPVEN